MMVEAWEEAMEGTELATDGTSEEALDTPTMLELMGMIWNESAGSLEFS